MQATKLEVAILEWIAGRQHTLAARLRRAEVVRREQTGAGCYVYLSNECDDWDRPPVDGPRIASPELDMGAGSLLWLSHGEPTCLEIYAFGDQFPQVLEVYSLSAADGRV